MLRFRTDLAGLTPFIAIMGYLWGRTTWAASRYGGYPFFTALGFTIIIFGTILFILGFVRTFIITRWFLFLFGVGLLAIGILFAVVGEFKGMYYLIATCWYEGAYGIAVGHDIFRHRIWYGIGKNRERRKLNKATRAQLVGLAVITSAIVSGIVLTQAWQFDQRTELQFTVSKDQMQDKEIVLYWVRQSMVNPQAFVDVLKATNTVLALQGNPDLFMGLGAYNKSSVDAANLVRLCNKAGAKVEIWPVGSQSLQIGLSLRYVNSMPVEYQYFKDWLHRNNITVTYYAFDIEDGDQWASFANSTVGRSITQDSALYGTLSGIYDMAARQEFLRVNRSNWPDLLAKQQALIDQIRADGFIPRATINPGAAGAMDGDLSTFEQNYEQS
ncbi:MAG TPA: hypothetical protein VKM55_08985 [Candidatus Lokiarchaeia archaeon]|nr:hypothetical protein [Candidatus Lokiarchaeia archaeon]